MLINKPEPRYKVFASANDNIALAPVEYGTGKLIVEPEWYKIANDNFEEGLASLHNDVTQRDINTTFHYLSKSIGYLFQQGVAEWNKYQDYPVGALVSYNGIVYISKGVVLGKQEPVEIKTDACGNPLVDCSLVQVDNDLCSQYTTPDVSDLWCALVDKCEYDSKIKELENMDIALSEMIKNLNVLDDIRLDDDKNNLIFDFVNTDPVIIPLKDLQPKVELDDKQNLIVTYPNGNKVKLDSHKATTRFVDLNGNVLGFVHKDVFKGNTTEYDKTITLITNENIGRGLKLNDVTKKLEIKPTDFISNEFTTDNDGNIKLHDNTKRDIIEKSLERVIEHTEANGIEVKLTEKNGLFGNGKAGNPIRLDLDELVKVLVPKLFNAENGKKVLDTLKENNLLGDGIDIVDGKLTVKTESITDASGTVHQFYAVDK